MNGHFQSPTVQAELITPASKDDPVSLHESPDDVRKAVLLELARVAAVCRYPDATPAKILADIRVRITQLRGDHDGPETDTP